MVSEGKWRHRNSAGGRPGVAIAFKAAYLGSIWRRNNARLARGIIVLKRKSTFSARSRHLARGMPHEADVHRRNKQKYEEAKAVPDGVFVGNRKRKAASEMSKRMGKSSVTMMASRAGGKGGHARLSSSLCGASRRMALKAPRHQKKWRRDVDGGALCNVSASSDAGQRGKRQ